MRKALLIILLSAALPLSILPGPSALPLFSGVLPACAQPAPVTSAKPKITFQGGPGDKPETAVVISGAPNSMAGIAAEYDYLGKHFGPQNKFWKLKRQSLLRQDGKIYDRIEIELGDGSKKTVFFDISEFFGKL